MRGIHNTIQRSITAHWLGRTAYAPAHALQQSLAEARVQGALGDTLLLLEHPPAITLGRGADPAHLLASSEALHTRGVTVHDTGRGGGVTYHGPGQLIAYLILDLKPDRCDVRRYVRDLAQVMVELLQNYGLSTGLLNEDPKFLGVWVDRASPQTWSSNPTDPAKIGALGVRLTRWVTLHGFALNLSTDLSAFDLIVPCGIRTLGVTSLRELSIPALPSLEDAAHQVLPCVARVFHAEVTLASAQQTEQLWSLYGAKEGEEPALA